MKKKFLSMYSLCLLPIAACSSLLSMEEKSLNLSHDSYKYPLEESMMITPVPTKRGFGLTRSLKDFAWDHEEENLYQDLLNKSFDPDNSSYHRKLDTAVEIFVDKDKDPRLTETFELCRKDYKSIKISDIAARKSHEYLTKKNKDKQIAFAAAVERTDQEYTTKQNVLIDELQKYVHEQLAKIKKLHDTHITERENLVVKEGDDIRRIKRGLVQLHHLNKTFKLPVDGYCSDEEKDADNVKTSYNNQHLLKKISVDFAMNQTKIRSDALIKVLYELNQGIQDIGALNTSHYAK